MSAITRSQPQWFSRPANEAASFSEDLRMQEHGAIGIHVRWTGTPTGTISIWVSNLLAPVVGTDGDWVDLGLTMPANPAGTDSSIFLSLSGVQARWLRFKYTRTSGTATSFTAHVDFGEDDEV